MAGRGPAPKAARRRRNVPARGDWTAAPGIGWQHGPIPDPPDRLLPETITAWETWMRGWVAAYWTPADLPGLRVLAGLFDRVGRKPTAAAVSELRYWLDGYGLSPKGRQDRRWQAPTTSPEPPPRPRRPTGRYAHLVAVPTPTPPEDPA